MCGTPQTGRSIMASTPYGNSFAKRPILRGGWRSIGTGTPVTPEVASSGVASTNTEGNLGQAASVTRKKRLIQLWPGILTNLIRPPTITIDDDAMEALDDRFVNFLSKR